MCLCQDNDTKRILGQPKSCQEHECWLGRGIAIQRMLFSVMPSAMPFMNELTHVARCGTNGLIGSNKRLRAYGKLHPGKGFRAGPCGSAGGASQGVGN